MIFTTLAENRLIEAQEQLDMDMLDKEVAEEMARGQRQSWKEVKEKLAVATVENHVSRGGASEFFCCPFSPITKFNDFV